MKTSLGLLVLMLLGAGAYVFYASKAENVQAPSTVKRELREPTSAMRVASDAVLVFEQRPGTEVTGTVYLSAPGYLVVHEDSNGSPGAILGASALLSAGENTGVKVTLSRAMKDGEMLHAMLHFEKGGNTTFSAAEDTPAPSTIPGEPVNGYFDVSNDAPTDPVIVI